jgi:DNA mismatch endonuclease, patch repair protein
MTDNLTPDQRRHCMARVRSEHTAPEMIVRRLAHRLGYRFRLHRADLPGKPDLVFPARRKVIFVHGCFWHVHDCPAGRKAPKTNHDYWASKRAANNERHEQHRTALAELGWSSLVVWECELRDRSTLGARIQAFLQGSSSPRDTLNSH